MRDISYHEAVGVIMWAATMTRPESQEQSVLSQNRENPGKKNWRANNVFILQYLRRTQDLGITYGRCAYSGTEMKAYADSDYATRLTSDWRSMTGGAVLLRAGAIRWFSSMQGTVAASSTEAEYIALIVQAVFFLL
ncbi:unnamed protein product [Sphacelaria rigidula]